MDAVSSMVRRKSRIAVNVVVYRVMVVQKAAWIDIG
jgi:hypothetical protein